MSGRPIPPLPAQAFYSVRDTSADPVGTRDTASLWNLMRERNAWLDRNKSKSTGWAQPIALDVLAGLDSASTLNGSAGDRIELGTFRVPSPGNDLSDGDSVVCYIYIGSYTSGGLEYFVQPKNKAAENIGEPSATGWFSKSFVLDQDFGDILSVYAVGNGAFQQRPESIWIGGVPRTEAGSPPVFTTAGGYEAPGDWEEISLASVRTADRPDSVAQVRALRRQQDHILDRRQRTLLSHSWLEPTTPANGGTLTYRYRLRHTRNGEGMSFYIYAESSDANAARLRLYVDTNGNGGTTLVDTDATVIAAGIYTLNAAVGDFTGTDPEELYEVHIVADGVTNNNKITVHDINADEDAFTLTDWYYGAEAANTRGNEAQVIEPEQPIVASYSGATFNPYTDRDAVFSDTVFLGYRRVQFPLWDRLGRDATSLLNEASSTTLVALSRFSYTPSYGIDYLDIHLNLWRNGAVDNAAYLKAALYVDGSVAHETSFSLQDVFGANNDPTAFTHAFRYDVTAGTKADFEIRIGFDDRHLLTETLTDTVVLSGAVLFEVPLRDSP